MFTSITESSTELIDMEARIVALQDEARRIREAYADDDFFRDNLSRVEEVERTAPAWLIQTRKVATSEANRNFSMLTGPMFTCEEFPWPLDSGLPMASLIQVDLRALTKLKGLPFGDGLLQVFIAPSGLNWEVRTVPRLVVEMSIATALPEFNSDEDSVASLAWAQDGGEFDEIVGVAEPVVSSYAEFGRENLLAGLPEDLRTFVAKMDSMAGNVSGPAYFFGTFYLVQHLPSECPPSLVCFNNDENFSWGGDGQAQVYYQFTGSEVEFTFNWTC